jgi:thymidylate synthase
MFNIIVAKSKNGFIGLNGHLPWNWPVDMEWFKRKTSGCEIICGRKTAESLPQSFFRRCRVTILTKQVGYQLHGATIADSWDRIKIGGECWVIGGRQVYDHAVRSPLCNRIYVTTIPMNCTEGDTNMFPIQGFQVTETIDLSQETQVSVWSRLPQDVEYHNYLRKLLVRPRIMGAKLTYTVDKLQGGHYRIPLITTKRLFVRGAFEELIWFIQGNTDTKLLEKKGVKIWAANTSKSYLEKRGLNYEVGDAGPIYGYQWRSFGKPYNGGGYGVDQLKYVIDTLRKNPNSRRAIMTSWNPKQLGQMCLPPCHLTYHWSIMDGKLHCCMHQRSGDSFLGIPFNMVHTTFLTIWLSQILRVGPGTIHHYIDDLHLYGEHRAAVKRQLEQKPTASPIFHMPTVRSIGEIERLTWDQISSRWEVKAPLIRAPIIT